MNREHIQRLLDRFNTGEATDAEKIEVEQLISRGVIGLDEIPGFKDIQRQVANLDAPAPSGELDRRFYKMLSAEKRKILPSFWRDVFFWPSLAPKLALASIALIIGIAVGYFFRSPASSPDPELATLSQQVTDLRETIMLSLLEKGSATERLKAVTLTQDMNEASSKVTDALIRTLNVDENVNVRLAALEALMPYASDDVVREALIRSIGKQQSPLVQISLAELMVALQEKGAVQEFQKIVESENTPPEVKRKIRKSIDVLI